MEKISLKETSVSVKEGDKKALSLNYYPQNTNDVKDVQWTSGNSTIAAVNSGGVVTGRNYGTATITAVCGSYKVSCKVSVKIPNSDEPLPAPKVKLSQKRADKIHLSWNRITGAKGYQVFYKTTKNGSYKKIASVKNTELSYDLASKPGTTYYVKVRAHGTNTKGKTKYSPSSAARSLKAIVPVPANVNFALAKDGGYITWDKLEGASGYVVYRYDSVAKTLKPNQTVWRDPKSMVSEGKYKLYEYHVKAFLTVNGKKIYSKPSKTVSLFA